MYTRIPKRNIYSDYFSLLKYVEVILYDDLKFEIPYTVICVGLLVYIANSLSAVSKVCSRILLSYKYTYTEVITCISY